MPHLLFMPLLRNALLEPALCVCLMVSAGAPAMAQVVAEESPIVIGRSFALASNTYAAEREINVWLPPGYDEGERSYPVLHVLDGGQAQDFHHISGLAQVGTISGATRDVIVVGVASVDRRNELALLSPDPKLVEAYPTQGDTARFRRFLRDEVLPFIEGLYRTSGETAVVGESLAGLFIVETFLKEPDAFDHYIAVSPSLWWDGGRLAVQAGAHLRDHPHDERTLYLTIADEGGEMQAAMDDLVGGLREHAPEALDWTYAPLPAESHATIYHGAALEAFRAIFAASAS